MELNEYQEKTYNFAMYPSDPNTGYLTIAIMGEAGEVCNVYKKFLRNGDEQTYRTKLIDETGDILWYLGAFATENGTFTLQDLYIKTKQIEIKPNSIRRCLRALVTSARNLDEAVELDGIEWSRMFYHAYPVLSYLRTLWEITGISMDEVMEANLKKLAKRYAEGAIRVHD